mgnify:CR=1 FL=1
MPRVFLGLGSNLGTRRSHLTTAIVRLADADGIRVVAPSRPYESEAHTLDDQPPQPSFLNAVVEIRTTLAPGSVLAVAQQLEQEAGRPPTHARWTPRPLDVDVLAYGGHTRTTDTLTIPHPRLAERRFVLQPWADIAPNFWIPVPFNQTVRALLTQCSDATDVHRVAPLSALGRVRSDTDSSPSST